MKYEMKYEKDLPAQPPHKTFEGIRPETTEHYLALIISACDSSDNASDFYSWKEAMKHWARKIWDKTG